MNAIPATIKNRQSGIHKKKGDFLMSKVDNSTNDFLNDKNKNRIKNKNIHTQTRQDEKRDPDPDPYRCEVTSSFDEFGCKSCSATDCTGLIPFLPQSEAELESYAELYPYFCDCFTESDTDS